MKPNRYIQVGRLTNSCLVGTNAYRICSDEAEFASANIEEVTDVIRQREGHNYMRVTATLDKTELWMVPFGIGKQKLLRLQDTMEHIYSQALGMDGFFFPFDLIEEKSQVAYLMRPIDRQTFIPIRKFMPDAYAERWQMSESLFQRVLELKKLGLTSNGFSREQLRVKKDTNQVYLWLNQTVSLVEGSEDPENILRHIGFLSIPEATEKACEKLGISISGTQRDIFSAAAAAFYLILYTHPFIGSGFYGLLREDYLVNYQHFPMYVMMGDSENNLGNQSFGRVVEAQWNRTVPQLKALFDQLFMAVTDPEKYWKADAPCWDPEKWLAALRLDAEANDNEASHSDFHFINEQYHQV